MIMNLKARVSREHSKANCLAIVKYVGTNKKRFGDLISIYLAGPYRITQRAAWPISVCVEAHPNLIVPHLKKILDFSRRPGVHVAVKRNTVRLLQFIDIPRRLYGQVVDIGFGFLADKKETVAVKVFAMTALANVSQRVPEIRNELKILIEDQLPYATAAFKSRAKKVLKQIG